MQIWAHSLVKNEERYLWFAVESVINYIDKLLLWDTGSTDKTKEIIKLLKRKHPEKIETNFLGEVTPEEFTKVRQDMLEATKSDWFLVVDGDEIWWDASINGVTDKIYTAKSDYESVVVPIVNLVGDIFHYQEKKAGRYFLAGKLGHYALRGIKRSIPGLSSSKPHGTWGWTDKDGIMIQERDPEKILFLDAPYIHATYLTRGGSRVFDKRVVKRPLKYKYELGIRFPGNFYYPEVFFRERPAIVPFPWLKMDRSYFLRALVETPLRKIKRRLFKGKIGY